MTRPNVIQGAPKNSVADVMPRISYADETSCAAWSTAAIILCPPPPASGDLKSHPDRPGDLDLLTLELARNVSRGTDNLPAYFRCFMRPFVVELWLNMYQTDDMTLLPWPLTCDVTAHAGDAGQRTLLYLVWGSSVSPPGDMAHFPFQQ